MINKSNINIVVIDDDEIILSVMEMFLESEDYKNISNFSSGNKALEYIKNNDVNIVFLDLNLNDIKGLDILKILVQEYPHIPVIIITGYNDVETAISSMRNGAYDFLVKPINLERISVSIKNALKYMELNSTYNNLKKEFFIEDIKKDNSFSSIVTVNKLMHKLFHYCKAISNSLSPVLITGETGVGKELFSKLIHDLSDCDGDFIAMDVSSYDNVTFKDALFGHIVGAYTGATNNRNGLLKKANSGTLFLDEIGDLSLELQSILLRVLQENEYRQNGSDKLLKTNARFIFATNRDLKQLIQEGKFRKDLYYRLETHSFQIPPLRERLDDISILFNHFVSEASQKSNIKIKKISEEVIFSLQNYSYPGNVRELRNIAYNAVSLCTNNEILLDDISNKINNNTIKKDYSSNSILTINNIFPTFVEAEKILVYEAMKRTDNNQNQAATLLGISRQALNKRLNKLKEE